MNPRLAQLQPYPFERLRVLLEGVRPSEAYAPVNLSIGEPKHATPALVRDALTSSLDGLAQYPPTAGMGALRESIAHWIAARYGVSVDPQTQVLPVNGSREALFAFAQTVVDASRPDARVVMPNPFYQIYEGAALLAGARPVFLNTTAANGFRMPFEALDPHAWRNVQLAYVCSPANPSGAVLSVDDWARLFDLAEAHDFVIASDECYSELYYDESSPPVGALQAAVRVGRNDFGRVVVFSSLSKRSNAPGLRSGFVAGDARVLRKFLLYRTYHGSAMSPPVQHASIAAWRDEAHVRDNRRQYAEKYRTVLPRLRAPLATFMPQGGFYLWITTPIDDMEFTRALYREYNVLVLPGSVLARDANGENPGRNHVRVALVAPLADCVEAVERISRFAQGL
ncbi:MAG: succinyldiaminopimelate transaminase [Gammaproteobacteria bacterium]|nr:succinyldiaminopimelate transaminase [Gammaproteobacteria bacterium]